MLSVGYLDGTRGPSILQGQLKVNNSFFLSFCLDTHLPFSSLLVVFNTFDLRVSVDAVYDRKKARKSGKKAQKSGKRAQKSDQKARKPDDPVPESFVSWMDNTPRIAVDKNGIPLVLHIPGWQSQQALVSNAAYI
jgi:hypothetical protein